MTQDSKVFRFHLLCPRCNKKSETIGMTFPTVKCGDCLIERVEMVEMKVLLAERL